MLRLQRVACFRGGPPGAVRLKEEAQSPRPEHGRFSRVPLIDLIDELP